jgi:hypothetical protein
MSFMTDLKVDREIENILLSVTYFLIINLMNLFKISLNF